MNFHILTLFPEMVMQGLNTSIIGRAIENEQISVEATNIRDFSTDKHKKVDDYPYGGGAGMLMQAQPVFDAYESVVKKIPEKNKKRVVYVTPQGFPFTQRMAEEFAKSDDLILLCGHYEGIDERVIDEIVTDCVSIGDYVLTGGELAAMVMVDAISRLVPGVLHNGMSAETESFHANLLEYPQYSRPEVWHNKKVPEILLSGNQKNIDSWRFEQSKERTLQRRPDLFDQFWQLQMCKEELMKRKLLNIDMIELINRGRAIFIFRDNNDILLQDKVTGTFYHSGEDFDFFVKLPDQIRWSVKKLVIHQENLLKPVKTVFSMSHSSSYYQTVHTLRERLSVTGLYRTDGEATEEGLVIRPLGLEYLEIMEQNYHCMDEDDYCKNRIIHGCVFGAFVNGKLAGFGGIHKGGSIGMITIFEDYENRNIDKALETYLINHCLSLGYIPYGQIAVDNQKRMELEVDLGLHIAKTPIIWVW